MIKAIFRQLTREPVPIDSIHLDIDRTEEIGEACILEAWVKDPEPGWFNTHFGQTLGKLLKVNKKEGNYGTGMLEELQGLKSTPAKCAYLLVRRYIGFRHEAKRFIPHSVIARSTGYTGLYYQDPRKLRYVFRKLLQTIYMVTGRKFEIARHTSEGIYLKKEVKAIGFTEQEQFDLVPDNLCSYPNSPEEEDWDDNQRLAWKGYYPHGEWRFCCWKDIGVKVKPLKCRDPEGHAPNLMYRKQTRDEIKADKKGQRRYRKLSLQKKAKVADASVVDRFDEIGKYRIPG
jgi:hypothetical protein